MSATLTTVWRFLCATAICNLVGSGSVRAEVRLGSATVVFATKTQAAEFLGRADPFVKALSPFDRQARLKASEAVDQDKYLQFVSQQALDWTDDEVAVLTSDLESMASKLSGYSIKLPDQVWLIKTTGLEEGGAAYTRGPAIILPQKRFAGGKKGHEGLLLHELFHVLSRHDAVLREKLYEIIGFHKCAPLQWPAAMQDLKLTNPDGPFNDHWIEVTHAGQPSPAIPVLFAKSAYDATKGGEFFQYLNFQLMLIEPPQADKATQPKLVDDQPTLLEPKNTEGFMSKIGNNTGYIIHPDEVLADNFVLLINGRKDVASPELLTKIAECLKSSNP